MIQLIKVNNSELSFRLKLNYNNVYSRLKMLLGKSASLFADIKTMSAATTWYADDNEEYAPLSEARESEARELMVRLGSVLKNAKKQIAASPELSPFTDDILDVPSNNFIFYRKLDDGTYKFILAGWGCKLAHAATTETGGLIRRLPKAADLAEDPEKPGGKTREKEISDDPVIPGNNPAQKDAGTSSKEEVMEKESGGAGKSSGNPLSESSKGEAPKKKKEQRVVLKVINQNMKPVEDEEVRVRTQAGEINEITDENGLADVGNLPYHSTFNVSFPNMPNIQERAYEVEPKVEQYDVYIKKYINYSPVLFVEDQNGNIVDNYNVKVVVAGQDHILNTGRDGMVQLPTMQEGQKFVVIDSANYANSEEYSINSTNVKKPFRFTIKRTVKSKVGITVLDKDRKPIEGAEVDVLAGDTPCQQTTDKSGRAEFPSEIFSPGDTALKLHVPGKGKIDSKLNFVPETSEYTIQLTGKKTGGGFNWKWLLMLPLLLALGLGAKMLYDKLNESKAPTIAEMEKGVVMVFGSAQYYADLNIPEMNYGGDPLVAYFLFDGSELQGYTFSPREAAKHYPRSWSGTGFLISKEDGYIATNKHVADPEPPEVLLKFLKNSIQADKDHHQSRADYLDAFLRLQGRYFDLTDESRRRYDEIQDSINFYKEQVRFLDKILNTGDFTIRKEIKLYTAFTGARVESAEDLIPCSNARIVGEPGGVDEIDLAIIQIKKNTEIPSDAFVFDIPEHDLMDDPIPDNYEITVLGYNKGTGLQNMKYQEGIKPQQQHGKINNTSERYRIGYDAATLGGSSGSPVLNKDGVLVAINNSGLNTTQGFNYGIRTKYLRQLLDRLKNPAGTEPNGSNAGTEQRKKTK